MTIFRFLVVNRNNNLLNKFTNSKAVGIFLWGKNVDDYIIIKNDSDGVRVVNLNDLNSPVKTGQQFKWLKRRTVVPKSVGSSPTAPDIDLDEKIYCI